MAARVIEWGNRRWYQRKDGYFANSRHGLLHRVVYRAINGPIPTDMLIHHRNGDKADNRIDNLELVTRKQHAAYHPTEFSEAHRAGAARAWAEHKANPRNGTCEECEASFQFVSRHQARFCSQSCGQRFYQRTKTGRRHETRTCTICGSDFRADVRWDVKTCSRSCTSRLAYRTRRKRLRPSG